MNCPFKNPCPPYENAFHGFEVKAIKESKLKTTYSPDKIVVYSTSYFLNYKYEVNERTFEYLKSLIHMIETFKYKTEYTSRENLYCLP